MQKNFTYKFADTYSLKATSSSDCKINGYNMAQIDDISFGIVPIRRTADGTQVMLGKSKRYGHYLLPKGHRDEGESDIEAAVRELMEETGHRPTLFRTSTGEMTPNMNEAAAVETLTYTYQGKDKTVNKSVVLYIAEVEQVTEIQHLDEVESIDWFPTVPGTADLLHFENSKQHFLAHILPLIS